MRSIGKWKIKTLKGLVRFELEKNPYVSAETIMGNLPDEWFDIWEGAWAEIHTIVCDEIFNYSLTKA